MLLPFFNRYPYTSMEQLNLDWMMERIGSFDSRITDNTNKITTERSERIIADDALRAAIDAEAAARAAADTALQSNIDAEASTRTAADDSLSSRITAEVNARTAADTTLQGNIDAEAGTRAAADTVLTNLINGKFSVVEITNNQGEWGVTSDNQVDLFDLNKNVMVYHDQSGVYYERTSVETHGNTTIATFTKFGVGTENVSITVEDEDFYFEDLDYAGGTTFTFTTMDGGDTVVSITYKSVNVENVLGLICEDRIAIDEIKPVVIEVTASGTLLADNTTYSTSFDDWSSLLDADDVVVVITDPNENVIKSHAVNVSSELVQFLLLDIESVKYIMNIETDVTPASISIEKSQPVYHNDIWVSFDSTTQAWYVREGSTLLITDEDTRTVLIDSDDPAHVKHYLVTDVTNNSDNTGSKIYFANYFCETDSVTNKAKLVYEQFIFEWNSNTSEYDISHDSFEIGSAT